MGAFKFGGYMKPSNQPMIVRKSDQDIYAYKTHFVGAGNFAATVINGTIIARDGVTTANVCMSKRL